MFDGILSPVFGAVVGLSLGLTGGGGAIFAVPLLHYAMGYSVSGATVGSLIVVTSTALLGAVLRLRQRSVDLSTGFVFSLSGMAGAPGGVALGRLMPEPVVLLLFGGLMVVVAARMNHQAARNQRESILPEPDAGAPCQRDADGRLRITTRCALVLLLLGAVAGVLSGLFGVGGGFIIVPALVMFSAMPIHRAVATSLMVISLVGLTALFSQDWSTITLPPWPTALFGLGSMAGLFAGQALAKHLNGPTMQRTFAAAMVLVALFIVGSKASSLLG